MHRLCIALEGDLSESSRLFSVSVTKDRFGSIFCLILHHHESINYFPCIHTRIVFLFVKKDLGEHYWNFPGSWEYLVIYSCISHEKGKFKTAHGLNTAILTSAVVLSSFLHYCQAFLALTNYSHKVKALPPAYPHIYCLNLRNQLTLYLIFVVSVKNSVRRFWFLSLSILSYIHWI